MFTAGIPDRHPGAGNCRQHQARKQKDQKMFHNRAGDSHRIGRAPGRANGFCLVKFRERAAVLDGGGPAAAPQTRLPGSFHNPKHHLILWQRANVDHPPIWVRLSGQAKPANEK